MDDAIFDARVKRGRETLEILLSEKPSRFRALLESYRRVYSDTVEIGNKIQGTPIHFGVIDGGIPITTTRLGRLFPWIHSLMGAPGGRSMFNCLHEIGEMTYTLPAMEQTAPEDSDEQYCLSMITMSDAYGDLLACTFSPNPPEESWKQVKLRSHPDEMELGYWEHRFAQAEYDTYRDFVFKPLAGYKFHLHFQVFYEKIFQAQFSLDHDGRKDFQLKLYDAVQKTIKEQLQVFGSPKIDNLQDIIFNQELIIKNLVEQDPSLLKPLTTRVEPSY